MQNVLSRTLVSDKSSPVLLTKTVHVALPHGEKNCDGTTANTVGTNTSPTDPGTCSLPGPVLIQNESKSKGIERESSHSNFLRANSASLRCTSLLCCKPPLLVL